MKSNIKIIEIERDNHNLSFDDKLGNLILNFDQSIKFGSFDELFYSIIQYCKENIFVLFDDLIGELNDQKIRVEIERRFDRINTKLLPLFHILFKEVDFFEKTINDLSSPNFQLKIKSYSDLKTYYELRNK